MDDLTLTPADPTNGSSAPCLSAPLRRVLSDMEDYWQDLSRAKRIPFRSEVDPSRIDVALPHAFIVQRVGRGTGRIRVAGGQVEALLGMDPRGMPLTTFFTPPGRVAIQHWFSEVFDRPAVVELPLASARGIGRPKLSGGMILLPLAAEDGSVSMALGALVTEGDRGRAPRRFDVPDGLIRLTPVDRTVEPAPRLSPNAQEIVTGLGPLAGIAAVSGTAQPAEKPYLRLVVDNS